MGQHGKDAYSLSSQTTKPKRDYLDARAEALGWSRAQVISAALDFWFALGAPAVTKRDVSVPVPADASVEMISEWEPYLPAKPASRPRIITAQSA